MTQQPIRVLLVDDEPFVLQALEERLRRFRARWKMMFAASGLEAVERLQRDSFDVVVSDMRMPQMDGTELLLWIKEHRPAIGRTVLSGQTDKETALKSLGSRTLLWPSPVTCWISSGVSSAPAASIV